MKKRAAKGSSIASSFQRWERTCIQDAGPAMKKEPGYAKVLSDYDVLKQIVEAKAQKKDRARAQHQEQCKDFAAACSRAATRAKDICKKAESLDVSHPETVKNTLPGWMAIANQVEAAAKQADAFRTKWQPCFGSARSCENPKYLVDLCVRAPDVFRRKLKSLVDSRTEPWRTKNAEKTAAKALKGGGSGDVGFALNRLDSMSQDAEQLLSLNAKLPASMRYGEDRLRALGATAKKLSKPLRAYKEKRLARARCPKGRKPSAKFRKLVKRHFERSGTTQVKVYRTTGASQRSYDRSTLVSSESIPGVACVKNVKSGTGAPTCRAIRMSVYREKPPGGAWTSWQVSVGGDEEILCKNAR